MMRTALSVAAIVLVASQIGSVRGQTQPASYGTALTGTIQSPICSSDNFASGDVSGDLDGSFYVAFDCQDETILGGSWLILVTAEGADGTRDVLGTIRGQVLNGSFEPASDSARITVRDVVLAISEGTGQYATVTEGRGSLEATSDTRDTPQFVGRLGLTFTAP
jgi:hypothetical protein